MGCPRWLHFLLLLLALLRVVLLVPVALVVDGLAFDFLPYAAPWIFVAGRIRGEACLSEASLPPLPSRDKNPRGSRRIGRAFLCLLSLARQRK
jgi:hypothetical protein